MGYLSVYRYVGASESFSDCGVVVDGVELRVGTCFLTELTLCCKRVQGIKEF